MPSQNDFLDNLFGSGGTSRKIGQPLKQTKLPSVDDYIGKKKEENTDGGIDFVSAAEKFKQDFGVIFSSTFRSPERNAKVGGTSNSYHLKGEAADIPTAQMTPDVRNKAMDYWKSLGSYDVIDEGDHIHVEPRPGVKSSTHYGAGEGKGGPKAKTESVPKKSGAEGFLDVLFDPKTPPVAGKTKPTKRPDKSWLDDSMEIVGDAANRMFGGIMDKAKNQPEQVERSPQEVEFLVGQEVTRLKDAQSSLPKFLQKSDEDLAKYGEMLKNKRNIRFTPKMANEEQAAALKTQETKEQDRESARLATADAKSQGKGFWEGVWNYIDNPVYGIVNKSLPANVMKTVGRQAVRNREDYVKLQQTVKTQAILDNPEKHPPEVVRLAQESVEAKAKAKEGQDPGIAQQWTDLRRAAKEHPERFVADFANALLADPEMMVAPVGIGIKPIQGTRAAMGIAATSRAARVADSIIDAGGTAAAMNVGIEVSAAAAEGRELSNAQAATSAGLGFVVGGALGPLFSKGAAARERIKAGKLSEADLAEAMRAAAKEELATETVIENPDSLKPFDRDVIEESLGIKNMSATEKKAWHRKKQAELKKTFEDQSLDADYYEFKADERISRRTSLEEAAEVRKAEGAAAAAKQAEVEQAYAEHADQRKARFDEDYQNAQAARDTAASGDTQTAAMAEDGLRNATAKLDQEDIIAAAFNGDVPAVRNAMLGAAQRDAKLRVPKWQRGEVDSQLIARVGIGALFSGAAFALADEDRKGAAAFAGGLAGLMLPGGGNVLRRMAQSGATTLDGDIISMLVKEGKMKFGKDAVRDLAEEAQYIGAAKQGDQQAFKKLFDDNAPRIQRYVNKQMGGVAARLGISAEDVTQEVFLDAFQQLDNFSGAVPFSAYLTRIAKNKAVDAIRDAQTLKGGKDTQTTSMYSKAGDYGDNAGAGEIAEGDISAIKSEVEGAAADIDTPENQAIRQQSQDIIASALEKLPERERKLFVLNKIEAYDLAEAADMAGVSYANARQIVSRVQGSILEAVEKGFAAKKAYHGNAEAPIPGDGIKRGRGRPRKEAGEIDPRLLRTGGIAVLGAAAGAYLNDQNEALGAGIGAMVAVGLMSKGRMGTSTARQLLEKADYTLGITSTRIMNKSPALWRRAIEHERVVLRDTHAAMKSVDPFLVGMQKLPKESKDILTRAILTGKPEVTNKILQALGDPKLIDGWKAVKSTLDSLKDQLVTLKRFKAGTLEYFPRIVKDVDGLLKALGNERGSFLEEAIKNADADAIRTRGTGLSDVEKSLIINKVLKDDKVAGSQPGFAKNRAIEEITPELQPFYASPTESLHSYIRSAVEDIERAKFFGKDIAVIEKGNKEYTNVDLSIGNVVNRLMNEGKLTGKNAEEVASLLKSRFVNGERAPAEIIQAAKNLSYAGLLGNPFSAVTQFGDSIIQAYTQDISTAINATVRSVTGRKLVNMKDFGLSDHIAEEFASTSKSAKALNKIFKYSLFKGVDEFGKDVALNAAVLKFGKLSKSEKGVAEIARRYGEALQPNEMNQLVKDLQSGEVTDLVRSIAFAELSRTQPITRLELPQGYLDNPNGRLLYQYKTFMLKQVDLARRDGYNELKAGNIAKGIKNLTELGIALGVAGTTTNMARDFLLGKDVNFQASDIPLNMIKTFGMSEYLLDHALGVSKEEAAERRADGDKFARTTKAEPLKTAIGMFTPPAKMFDDIVRGDPKAVRYIPMIGPYLYEQYQQQKAEKSE